MQVGLVVMNTLVPALLDSANAGTDPELAALMGTTHRALQGILQHAAEDVGGVDELRRLQGAAYNVVPPAPPPGLPGNAPDDGACVVLPGVLGAIRRARIKKETSKGGTVLLSLTSALQSWWGSPDR